MPALLNTNDANAWPAISLCYATLRKVSREGWSVFTSLQITPVVTSWRELNLNILVGASFQTVQNSLAFPISRVGKIREKVQTRKEKQCVRHNMGSLKTLWCSTEEHLLAFLQKTWWCKRFDKNQKWQRAMSGMLWNNLRAFMPKCNSLFSNIISWNINSCCLALNIHAIRTSFEKGQLNKA